MNISVNVGVRPEVDFDETMAAAAHAGLQVTDRDADFRYAHGTIADRDLGKLDRVAGLVVEPDRSVTALG